MDRASIPARTYCLGFDRDDGQYSVALDGSHRHVVPFQPWLGVSGPIEP